MHCRYWVLWISPVLGEQAWFSAGVGADGDFLLLHRTTVFRSSRSGGFPLGTMALRRPGDKVLEWRVPTRLVLLQLSRPIPGRRFIECHRLGIAILGAFSVMVISTPTSTTT
jgi:hypothetical protein